MAETTDQILGEIAKQRKHLGESIDELESYVREKADVRVYYERKPWAFLGGAALGGVLLARIILGRGSNHRHDVY